MAQARFIFSLEPLLDLRKQVEKEHQRKVAVIQQEINVLVSKIHETERSIKEQNHALSSQQLTGQLDLAYIANEKRYVGTLQMLIVQTLQKLAMVERQMAGAKAALLAAARDRKVIEKLRERHYQRWLEEQNRKEAAELDEIGTQLALRQGQASEAAES